MQRRSSPVVVVGRFPPPLDGQTLATARLADLVEEKRSVVRVSTSAPEGERLVSTEARWSWRRLAHYVSTGRRIRRRLAAVPDAPVLWASISPHPLGHARDVLTTLPAFGASRRVIAVVHRAYVDRMFQGMTARTARRVVGRCEAMVFLTDGLAERAAPFVPEAKRIVIPNTVGADVLCSRDEVHASQPQRQRRREVRLLFLGNLMPEKGYLDALAVAERLLADHDVRLDLIGRWPSPEAERAFRQRVADSGLADRVTAHGGVAHAEVKSFVLGADVLLFPSTHPSEALPVAVLEALGAGTPVVGYRHAGLPEVVRDGAGVLVPAGDVDALAEATRHALASWRSMSEGARSRFEAAYAPEAVQAAWLSLLDRTGTGSAGPDVS